MQGLYICQKNAIAARKRSEESDTDEFAGKTQDIYRFFHIVEVTNAKKFLVFTTSIKLSPHGRIGQKQASMTCRVNYDANWNCKVERLKFFLMTVSAPQYNDETAKQVGCLWH